MLKTQLLLHNNNVSCTLLHRSDLRFFAVGFHADAETDWKHNVVIFFEGTDYKGKFIILVSSPKDFQ